MNKDGRLAHIDWLYCVYVQPIVAHHVTHSVCVNINSIVGVSTIDTFRIPIIETVIETINEMNKNE